MHLVWWCKWGQWQDTNNDDDYDCNYNYITDNQSLRVLHHSAVAKVGSFTFPDIGFMDAM